METQTQNTEQFANSELFLLPHFFNKMAEGGEESADPNFAFTQLLESDSVLGKK